MNHGNVIKKQKTTLWNAPPKVNINKNAKRNDYKSVKIKYEMIIAHLFRMWNKLHIQLQRQNTELQCNAQ